MKNQILNVLRKQFFLVLTFISLFSPSKAQQGVAINTSGAAPLSSAILDVTDTTKGILIPRVKLVSVTDVVTIASPANSLLVFNNNATITGGAGKGFYFYNGAKWQKLNDSLSWNINGNSGTVDGTHFIGTTDNAPLNFKINNQKAGKIEVFGNTIFGYQAANVNQSGKITAYGNKALFSNNFGFYNTAIGEATLYANYDGAYDTALGAFALSSHKLGSNNTALGHFALFSDTSGTNNTAVGYYALSINRAGTGNTSVGNNALIGDANHINCSAFGFNAFAGGGGAMDNSMALGYNTNVLASNSVRIGNSLVTSIGGGSSWTALSDGRFKKNILENVPGLNFILTLRPVTYNLDLDALAKYTKQPDSARNRSKEIIREADIQTGFIAQEVEQAANNLGYKFSGVDKPKNSVDTYGLRYAEFTVPLVKAVQEQQIIIDKLNQKLDELTRRINTLEKHQ
jgi:trimeric autotransporter adhesin